MKGFCIHERGAPVLRGVEERIPTTPETDSFLLFREAEFSGGLDRHMFQRRNVVVGMIETCLHARGPPELLT